MNRFLFIFFIAITFFPFHLTNAQNVSPADAGPLYVKPQSTTMGAGIGGLNGGGFPAPNLVTPAQARQKVLNNQTFSILKNGQVPTAPGTYLVGDTQVTIDQKTIDLYNSGDQNTVSNFNKVFSGGGSVNNTNSQTTNQPDQTTSDVTDIAELLGANFGLVPGAVGAAKVAASGAARANTAGSGNNGGSNVTGEDTSTNVGDLSSDKSSTGGGNESTGGTPAVTGSSGASADPTANLTQKQIDNILKTQYVSGGVSSPQTNVVCTAGTCVYQLLAPIPGFLGDASGRYNITQDSKSLCSLFNQWFRIGIAIAGMLAVVMIVLGGFQYATTDSLFDKSDGKGKIQNALWGLLLALTTWLVLNTINPALTNCTLNVKPITLSFNQSIDSIMGAANSAVGVVNSMLSGQTITTAPDGGIEVSTTGVRLDSDGIVAPPYNDPTRQWETTYKPNGQSMDATTQAYVVAPLGPDGKSTVPMGTPALIQDLTTGKQVWAVVGDAGPAKNGWGEMSVFAAKQIGATAGTSDSAASDHKIKITYYPNK